VLVLCGRVVVLVAYECYVALVCCISVWVKQSRAGEMQQDAVALRMLSEVVQAYADVGLSACACIDCINMSHQVCTPVYRGWLKLISNQQVTWCAALYAHHLSPVCVGTSALDSTAHPEGVCGVHRCWCVACVVCLWRLRCSTCCSIQTMKMGAKHIAALHVRPFHCLMHAAARNRTCTLPEQCAASNGVWCAFASQ
jgi:hypothetical protein